MALQQKESNAWLEAFPSRNIGTHLDNNQLRISLGLRLGGNICRPYTCSCNESVDCKGFYPLSCNKSSGRHFRHNEINHIIKRALGTIEIPSILEPTGISRDDGKRPDGVTLTPWSKGQCLVWDATCVDTFAQSYLPKTSVEAGAAAEIACKRKHSKYQKIKENGNIFKAFAVETMGPWSQEAKDWIDIIGSNLIHKSGDPRSKFYLIQRIGMAIQRGNVASILGSLPEAIPMEEIFYL